MSSSIADPGSETERGPTGSGALAGQSDAPAAGFPLLLRPRLFELLNTACRRRVVLVEAPAGAGKTMLLDTWLHGPGAPLSAWRTLDRRDDDPQVFWPGLVQALRRSHPAARVALTGLGEYDETFAGRVLDAAAALTEPVVVVLDDLHKVTAASGIETLVRHAPPTLRLVLAGRAHPALPLARMRVAGELAEFGFDDLACTTDEAGDLLRLLGVDLAADQVGLLLAVTEGWMTGLRLVALWYAAQPAGGRDVAGFGGDARIVADYLADEVMLTLDRRTRRFLLRTCIVDDIHGSLADALTGGRDGARLLDELERRNAPVTAVDPRRRWFRYRGLFRDFLRSELGRQCPDEIPRLYRRAARWYAGQDAIAPAVRAAVAGGDLDYAGLLLGEHGHRLLAAGHAELGPLLRAIPDDRVRADPRLASVAAHLQLRMSDPEGAEPYLRIAEPSVRTRPDEAGDQLTAEVRYADLRLVQASLRGAVGRQAIKVAHDVLDRAGDAPVLPDQQSALGELAFHLGLAHLWQGETVAARKALDRGVRRLDGDARQNAGAWHVLLNATEGRLRAADDTISVLRAVPAAAHGTDPLLDLARAGIWIERDRLHDAWDLLRSVPATSTGLPPGDGAEIPLAIGSALIRARVHIARGSFTSARSELAAARHPAAGLSPHLQHDADLLEAEILTLQGRTDDARRVLYGALESQPLPDLARSAVALGKHRLAAADPAGALAAVLPCLEGTATEIRLLDLVAAHLVGAEARRLMGASGAARDHLEHALALAAPDELIRVFLDGGRPVRSLLTVLVPDDGPHGQMRSTLLWHFEAELDTAVRTSRRRAALTGSERAVLAYLPSLLTNEEIAGELCLSVNTIKSHLRSLYRKLDVSNRRDAVISARRLALLSDSHPTTARPA